MAEFTLPQNSRVVAGKEHPRPAGATRTKTFKVYRWDPDTMSTWTAARRWSWTR
jgi:succinate dehydrogenase / fumarate reductase iron-sulfur subunit